MLNQNKTKIREIWLIILYKQIEDFEKASIITKRAYIDFSLKQNLIGLKEQEIKEWEKESIVYELFKEVYSYSVFQFQYESLKKLNEEVKFLEIDKIVNSQILSEKVNEIFKFYYRCQFKNLYLFKEMPYILNMRYYELHFWVFNAEEIKDDLDISIKKFRLSNNNENVKYILIEIFRKFYEIVSLYK